MKRVLLERLAFARSGDKGRSTNVGVVARNEACYALLREQLTCERVAAHFAAMCPGPVERYELPNLKALNFILNGSLGDGGSSSLRTDAQGKIHGQALLLLELSVPDGFDVPPA